jgi:hypothetical protein
MNEYTQQRQPTKSYMWPRIPFLVIIGLIVFEYGVEFFSSSFPIAVAIVEEESTRANASISNTSNSNEALLTKPVPSFAPLWKELALGSCRLPEFYDPTRSSYNLSQSYLIDSGWKHREQLKAASYKFDMSTIVDNSHEYYQMLLRKQQPSSTYASLRIQRNISFLHIGKAGGSTIACHLAEPRKYVRKHCDSSIMRRPVPLSALSIHVNCFAHMSGHLYCSDVNDAILINARQPIHRMGSWFLYEHPLNHHVNYAERDFHCGDLMLYSCYPSFDALATMGLAGSPPADDKRQLKIGPHLTLAECADWAWAAVQGDIPATYHNFYNYDWYTHRLFDMQDTTLDSQANGAKIKEIFVIRAEHLEQDWRAINEFLGSDYNRSMPATLTDRQNSAHSKPLPVFDDTISSTGIRNLCRALCKEIRIYMKLLSKAVNMRKSDISVSLQELHAMCPVEDLPCIRRLP